MAELHDFAGLAASLERTLAAAVPAVGVVELSVPPRPEHGDVSTNAALVFGGRAKRAPRKSVKKSVAAEPALEPAAPGDAGQVEPASVPATAPAVQNFGLLFQPPAPTEAPRRRRATAPAA